VTSPRWDITSLRALGTRVCIRIGHRWPECRGHTLAYFIDSVDAGGMCAVWDLTADVQFTAPKLTSKEYWTSRPSTDVNRQAAADLEMSIGDRVTVLRNLT
jgi:hypothetical protein